MWMVLLQEFWSDLKSHRLRAILTIIAIAWGTLCVVLLLAFGEGLGHQLLIGLKGGGVALLRARVDHEAHRERPKEHVVAELRRAREERPL